jgi:hypothetical protein
MDAVPARQFVSESAATGDRGGRAVKLLEVLPRGSGSSGLEPGSRTGRAYTDESVCPSLSFLVFRYLRVESLAGISSGTASDTARP